MPYKTLEEAPAALRGIDPPITLAQANTIAEWADAIEKGDNPPKAPWAVAIAQFRKTHEVKDGAWVRKGDNQRAMDEAEAPGNLVALAVALGPATPAEAGEGDGLIWKEIIHPGTWFKTDSGRQIEVTPEIIDEALRAFEAGFPKHISVPVDSHHAATRGVVPPDRNRGFVRKLVKRDGHRVFGGFDLRDASIAAGVKDGTVADCSVYLQPNVTHPETGQKFAWALRHVLLTNDPLVQDLGEFGALPATSTDGALVVDYYRPAPEAYFQNPTEQTREEDTMPRAQQEGYALNDGDEIVLSGAAAEEYAQLAGLGLSAARIMELAALAEREAEIKRKARAIEVTRITRALEGLDEHPAVVQIAGRRHYPVVIEALAEALEAVPDALALDAGNDGATAIDAAMLAIVNAIPAEGRLPVEQPRANAERQRKPVAADGQERGDVTDEQVDTFLAKVG